MSRRPAQFDGYPAWLMEVAPFGPYRCVIALWIDGDTCDVFVDLGLNKYGYETIRLRDVDAPEINRLATRDAGMAAKAFVEELAPQGTPVVIETIKDVTTFGRYVADIMLPDGRDLGAELVNAGHAVARIAH